MTPNGKLDRKALPATEETPQDSRHGYVAPGTPTEQALVEIWAEVLHGQQIGVQENFFDIGGHSLLVLQVLAKIKKVFGVDIPLSRFFENPTIFGMAAILDHDHKTASQDTSGSRPALSSHRGEVTSSEPGQPPELVAIQPRGDQLPLFFIHPAGGVVFPYYDLAYLLPPDQPFWGIQDPSMSGKSEPLATIGEYAARYLSAIRWLQPGGPYCLAGWSFGGLVAFEIARQLGRDNQAVAFLGLLDTEAPLQRTGNSLRERLYHSFDLIRAYLRGVGEVGGYLQDGFYLILRQLQQRSSKATGQLSLLERLQLMQVDAVRQTFLKQSKVESLLQENVSLTEINLPGISISRVLKIVRAHQRLALRYTPQPYAGRITLFTGEMRSKRQARMYPQDPTLGWGHLAGEGVDIHPMPANHILLLRRPFVTQLAAELQECLESNWAKASDHA